MKRTGVIFGGRSGEHEISIRSANAVIENFDAGKYAVIPIAIDHDGKWLSLEKSIGLLRPAAIEALDKQLLESFGSGSFTLSGDSSHRGLVSFDDNQNFIKLDVAFPVLHGTFGEDGTIQGLFEMAGIPYVGCGVLASSCGMDKTVMKSLFKEANLPVCRHVWFLRRDWLADKDRVANLIETSIGFPSFVKPANLGSSVGISRADDRLSLFSAIDLAATFDRKIIVEEALKMREIECAVLGNDEPEASLPGEYIIRNQQKAFLDYTEKYSGTGNNEFVVPSPISAELTEKIQKMAIDAFKSIDGAGLARVDFFLRTDNGLLLVNEINTMPGLTDASGFPKMWAGSGKDFRSVLDTLVELAIERKEDVSSNVTSV